MSSQNEIYFFLHLRTKCSFSFGLGGRTLISTKWVICHHAAIYFISLYNLLLYWGEWKFKLTEFACFAEENTFNIWQEDLCKQANDEVQGITGESTFVSLPFGDISTTDLSSGCWQTQDKDTTFFYESTETMTLIQKQYRAICLYYGKYYHFASYAWRFSQYLV